MRRSSQGWAVPAQQAWEDKPPSGTLPEVTPGRSGKAVPGASEPQEHGVEPNQAQCLAVELAHLGEHVGLLDPLDDVSVVDPDVVEEAGLVGALGGRRAV